MILVHPGGGGAIYCYDYMREQVENKRRIVSCKKATLASNRQPSDGAVSCNLHHPCYLNTWHIQHPLGEFISFSLPRLMCDGGELRSPTAAELGPRPRYVLFFPTASSSWQSSTLIDDEVVPVARPGLCTKSSRWCFLLLFPASRQRWRLPGRLSQYRGSKERRAATVDLPVPLLYSSGRVDGRWSDLALLPCDGAAPTKTKRPSRNRTYSTLPHDYIVMRLLTYT
jgi:hypothetical protein